MALSGEQVKRIHEALLDAYPSEEELRMMVRIELDESLEAVATGKNQRVLIFNLVTWAERTGRVDDLVQGAYNQTPGNLALQALMQSWSAASQSGGRAEPSSISPEPSGAASVDVFLSYSRKDSEVMHKVQKTLRDAGLAVWTDEGLEPGTPSWRSEIEEAVGQASAMVVLLSPNSKSSRWVDNEVGYAQTLGKAVFPVLIAGDNATAVPISLINTQWVDGRRQVDTVVRQRLLPAIEGLVRAPAVETSPSPEPAPPAARPWVWLGVGAAILIVAALLGWWALANFGGFRIVGPSPNPSAMVGAEEVVPPVLSPTNTSTVTATRLSTNTATPTTTSTPASTPTRRPTPPSTPVPTATPTGTSAPLPAAGATRTKDGSVYVYVPAGPFIMGSSDSDPDADQDEKPQQPALYLDAFWIMQTEVTSAQYANCVAAGACSEPSNDLWNSQEYAQHPVAGVDWHQANAYAQWAGGRLPSEAEWEKACRGTDGRIFPWGNDPATGEFANFDSIVGATTPVGSYPKGASPYGVLDLAGNVWEWTSTTYSAYPYDPADGREAMTGDAPRTVRGGAWYYYARSVRCARRDRHSPFLGDANRGFRVLSPGF